MQGNNSYGAIDADSHALPIPIIFFISHFEPGKGPRLAAILFTGRKRRGTAHRQRRTAELRAIVVSPKTRLAEGIILIIFSHVTVVVNALGGLVASNIEGTVHVELAANMKRHHGIDVDVMRPVVVG